MEYKLSSCRWTSRGLPTSTLGNLVLSTQQINLVWFCGLKKHSRKLNSVASTHQPYFTFSPHFKLGDGFLTVFTCEALVLTWHQRYAKFLTEEKKCVACYM